MRQRAFKPDSLGPLEARNLLSGGAKPQIPVALSGVAFNTGTVRIRGYFEQYALGGNFRLLRTQLAGVSTATPFGRQDGLGAKTNAILDQMRRDQADGVPGAIRNAYNQVTAGIKADVDARIANGTVRVFDRTG